MYKWYLPTLSEIIASGEPTQGNLDRFPAQQLVRAEREWSGSIAALSCLLQQITPDSSIASTQSSRSADLIRGVLLSGPFPLLERPDQVADIATWTFTVASRGEILQLLPAANQKAFDKPVSTLPLLPNDPLAAEQFCLALTPEFSLAMVLGETVAGDPAFMFSFEPEVVWQVWRSLEARIKLTTPQMINAIAVLVNRFSPVIPDYRTVMQFSRLMLSHLPQPSELEGKRAAYPDGQVFQEAGKSLISIQSAASSQGMESKRQSVWQREVRHSAQSKSASASQGNRASEKTTSTETTSTETTSDTELLQAIAHEVRTPLTTIRTLTRLLLRRKDLNPDVIKRLEIIDRECTEQIDRFTLIFRAVELETTQPKNALAALAPISLDQVLQQTIPRWQQQANQYNHTLDVILPQKLPLVITDPTMLDQVLTGLIDRITHSLPPGSHIQVRVSLAGHQLKLQLESQPQNPSSDSTGTSKSKFDFTPALKSIGQLLMFQPETGNLSLNMTVTKNLFQALGGKLIVRQRPQQGEVLTIFLPLDTKKDDL